MGGETPHSAASMGPFQRAPVRVTYRVSTKPIPVPAENR